ncbi:MAG: hypothetical protein AAFP13_15645 [Pseudomonadota bacterium]
MSARTAQPLAIYAQGVATAAPEPYEEGAQALGLAGAAELVATGATAFERHADFVGQDGLPALGAWVPEVLAHRAAAPRLAWLAEAALRAAFGPDPAAYLGAIAAPAIVALPGWLAHGSAEKDAIFEALDATLRAAGIGEWHHSPLGHTGGIRALEAAQAILGKGDAPAVLVIGLDSRTAPASRDLAMAAGRGQTQEDPYAAVPGEAAAALLLALPGGVDAPALGVIEAVAMGTEPERLDDTDRGTLGRGLAACLDGVLPRDDGSTIGHVFTDGTGERFRGEDYGGAVMYSGASRHDAFEDPTLPAQSLGDTGAASVPLSVALALVLAPGQRSVIVSGNADGSRGALRLRSLLQPKDPPGAAADEEDDVDDEDDDEEGIDAADAAPMADPATP